MVALPESFVASLRRRLGDDEAAALCAALDGASPTAVRRNPAKGCAFAEGQRAVPWCRGGIYLDERPQFTLDTAFHAGSYYVQEAGSQFVDYLLATEQVDGGRVLDMCAAPGGKTTIYASAVGREGLVVANEYVRNRANILADNVRKWGLGNVVVTNNEPRHLAAFEGWFDVVAVDAPCSGEGMFRKDETARSEWSEDSVRMCAARQMDILREAWRALKDGGLLIYSTCTFNEVEDEGVLEAFVAEEGDALEASATVAVDASWGVTCGSVGPFQTFRFWPHRVEAEGFFVAVARKSEGACGTRQPKPRKRIMNDLRAADKAEVARWVEEPEKMRFAEVGDTIYGYASARYDEVKALAENLTVIYSGVAMGQIFKGRLKPDWALSQFVGLRRAVLPCVEVEREEALEYLRRHDIAASQFEDGMNLVMCDGLALGFIKRVGARCNNLYPNSLKIVNK